MNVKWIVTDMDGTLLNGRDEIGARTKEALMVCQKKGIRLILASGRSYVRQMPYARELVLKEAEAAKWLSKDERNSVRWLPADLTLIEKIKKSLEVELHE